MNHKTFFFIILLIFPIITSSFQQPSSAQQSEVYRGNTYQDTDLGNSTHIWQGGLPTFLDTGDKDSKGRDVFVPYRIYDKEHYVTFETGSVSWTFSKDSCTGKLYTNGRINSTSIPTIENISYISQEALIGTEDWTVTQHNSMPCQVTLTDLGDGVKLLAKQGNDDIKYKEIELNEKAGQSLEVTLRTPEVTSEKANYRYGFAESQIKSQDVIIDNITYSTNIKNSTKFNSSKFTEQVGNKINDIPIKTKNSIGEIEYNTENSKHGTLSDVEIKKYTPTKLQTVINYHNTDVLPVGQRLEIDPTYSSNNPTEDGVLSDSSITGVACNTTVGTRNTSHANLNVIVRASGTNDSCYRTYIEYDVSSITDGSTITDTVFKFDLQIATNAINCDYKEMNTKPSTATDQQVWDDIGDGTTFVSNDSTCTTTGDNKSLDLGSSADSDVATQLSSDWWAFGIKANSETRDASTHTMTLGSEDDATATPKPTLEITYTTPCTPNAPSSVTAKAQTTTSINIDWTNSSNCTNNAVEVQRSPDQTNWTTLYSGAVVTHYGDTGLPTNTQFYYRVRDQSSDSIWGSYSSTANAVLAPATPTGLTHSSQTNSGFRSTWSVSGNATTGFKVERETPTGGGFSTIVANTGNSTTHYDHSGLAADTQYNVKISTINANATSSASTPASTYTLPDPPTSLGLTTISTTQINLSWTPPSGTVTGYKIEEKIGAGSWTTRVADTGTTATTYSATSLTAGTQYTYRVSTITSHGTSVPSNEPSAYTITNAPTSLGLTTISASQINLSWTAPSGTVTGYKIEEKIGSGSFTIRVADTGTTATTYSATSLAGGTQYSYRVSAINSGGTSAASNEPSIYTITNAPTSLSAIPVSTSQIDLLWNPPSGTVTGYKIERQTHSSACSGGAWSTIVADTGSTTTSYSNTGLALVTCYSYRVSAINSGGTSTSSNVALSTTASFPNLFPISPSWTQINVGSSMTISDLNRDGVGDVIYTRSGNTLTKQFGSLGTSSFTVTNNSPDILYAKENRILAKSNSTTNCNSFIATQWNLLTGSSINTLTGTQSTGSIDAYAGIINTNNQTGLLCAKTSSTSDWNLLIHDTPNVNSTATGQAFSLTVINGGPYHLGFASSSGLNKVYTYANTFYTNSTVSNTKYISKTSENKLNFDGAFTIPSNVYVDNNIPLYSTGLDYPERTLMNETKLIDRLATPVNNTVTILTNLPPRILNSDFTSPPVYLLINDGTTTYFAALLGTKLYYTDYDALIQEVELNRALANYRIDPKQSFLGTSINGTIPTTSITIIWPNGTSTTYNAPPQVVLLSGYHLSIPSLVRTYYPDYTNNLTYLPFGAINGTFTTMTINISLAPTNGAIMISNSSKYNNEKNFVDHVTFLQADHSWSGSLIDGACYIISVKDADEKSNPWVELGKLCNSGTMPKTIPDTTTLPLTFWALDFGATHIYNQTTDTLLTSVRSATQPFTYNLLIKNSTGDVIVNETHTVSNPMDVRSYNVSSVEKPASLHILVGGSQIYSAFLGSSISLAGVSAFFHTYFSYGGFDLIAFIPLVFASMFSRNTVGVGVVMTVVCIATISWLSIVIIPDVYIGIMALVAVLSLIGYKMYNA